MHFSPTIVRPNNHVEFPRPVVVFRILESWDAMKLKVPLQNGDQLAGHSRKGTDITIEGQIGSHSGNLKLSEVEMFEALETLRTALHVNHDEDPYSLSIFFDSNTAQHRYFKNCSTIRFDFDLSDKHIYSYIATIHAANPSIHHGTLA